MSTQVNLNVKCLHCGESYMDHKNMLNNFPSVKLKIVTSKEEGNLWLCSSYGCYDHKSNIEIPKGEEVKFSCIHCDTELNTDVECKLCGAGMVKFNIEIGGVVSICSRNGCQNHYVMFEDLAAAIRKFHRAYGL